MPAPNPQPDHRQLRQRLEEQLLAEVKQAEIEFHNAPPDQKEAVAERYRQTLRRFNDLILDRKPPGSSTEP
jgi:TRAP-type C4-dicarboxylate transport system substrate-binding protein